MNKNIGIYIHIPFCKSKCYYCDFVSSTCKENLIERYIDALCQQILQNSEILSEYNITTIYFGGGTPSYIDSKYIKRIIDILSLFSNNIEEATIEINPGTVNENKMIMYKECGINRLSIGLQSTHDNILKHIGRIHTYSDFINVLKLSKKIGFDNISVDLMYPLPELTLSKFKESVDKVIELKNKYNIKHVSIYNLELHENTKLDFLIKEGFLNLVDEDEEYNMKLYLENELKRNGFKRYEISNFAIEGYASKHNLNYWNQGMYLGFGVAASSFFDGTRYTNLKDIENYINSIFNNENVIEESESLDKLGLMKEYVILRLRLEEGLSINQFKKRFECDIFSIFKKEINELIENKLLEKNGDKILLSKRGKEVANIVWEYFI